MDKWLKDKTQTVIKLHKAAEKAEVEVKKSQRIALACWMDVGRALAEVHSRVGPGFREWVDGNFPGNRVRAYELEKVFLRFGNEKLPEGASTVTALIILARAPALMRQKAVDSMCAGSRMSVDNAKSYAAGFNPPPPEVKEPVIRESKDEMRERLEEFSSLNEALLGQLEEAEDQVERLVATVNRQKATIKHLEKRGDDLARQLAGARA